MNKWRHGMLDLRQVLRSNLSDERAVWNMGSFGASVGFSHGKGEKPEIDLPALFECANRHGAIRLHSDVMGRVVPVAYETLGPGPDGWDHGLALCLPRKNAARSDRHLLTELGPDGNAVCEENRQAILFDIGLGLPECDVCLRTDDPALLAVLRANLGRSLFEPGNRAARAILQARPHGVVLTRIGRIETYRMIREPAMALSLPLATRLSRQILQPAPIGPADLSMPDDLVPLAYLRPAHPVMDNPGNEVAFDIDDHVRFQTLFERYARADLPDLRREVLDALANGMQPMAFPMPSDRFGRATVRITLRQQYRLAQRFGGGSYLHLVSQWRGALDTPPEAAVAGLDPLACAADRSPSRPSPVRLAAAG